MAASPRPFYTARLFPAGGKLIISNNPEEVNGQGILYRDRVQGAWRVCVHHQNKTGSEPGGTCQPIQLLIILTNQGRTGRTVTVERSGAGVHDDPQEAGCRALRQFLTNAAPCRQEILPGQSLAWGVSNLRFGDTFSGLYDYYAAADLDVSVTALPLNHRVVSPEFLAPFQKHLNQDGSYTIRGTFPYRALHGHFLHYAGAGWQGTQLGNSPYGNYLSDPWWDWVWSQVYNGEYPAGWNALDGETVYNWGNYGVFYHLEFSLEHKIPPPLCTRVLLNPRGGTFYGPVQVDHAVICPVNPVTPLISALDLKNTETGPGVRKNVCVSFMPAGGSSLPVRILLGNV